MATTNITRSPGLAVANYIVGGGLSGATEDLDATVARAAEMLADAYRMDVTIRFNSDRRSGGAWLKTHEVDSISANAEIGLCAQEYLTHAELVARRWWSPEDDRLNEWPDGGTDVFVHISAHSLRNPSILTKDERYIHRPMSSLNAALAFAQEHGTILPK